MKKEIINKDAKSKKKYSKPEIQEHKALALISGSGDDDCNYYVSRVDTDAYYF